MSLDIVKQFNWVDIFFIILLARICYISGHTGLPVEIFKLLGSVAALYLSFQYSSALGNWVAGFWHLTQENSRWVILQVFSFLFLGILGYAAFLLLRIVFYRFMKMEAVPHLNRWGGVALGCIRVFILSGMIFVLLLVSNISYFRKSVAASTSGKYLALASISIYKGLLNGLTSKFMPAEKLNDRILKLQEDLNKK